MSDSSMNPTRIRLAVVGCGAVTRNSLLPVLAGHERVELVALVDRSLPRARELADAYGVSRVLDDVAALSAQEIDAVVLATPPAHHAPATLDLLRRGLHVFVEKPMATTAADAEAMVAAADAAGRALGVGLYRRLLPVTRLLRALVDSEMLGRPVSVDIEEGGEYSWQLATLSVLTREGGGGGVLIDIGSHLLDQVLFLLPGTVSITRYADNARGGIETDCELTLSVATRTGAVPVRVELSRTRQLRGSIQIVCEHGRFELMRGDFTHLRVSGARTSLADPVLGAPKPFTLTAHWDDEREVSGYKAFRDEFDDWIEAIDSHAQPQLSGASVVPVVRVIEECYASPVRLEEPWVDGGLAARPEAAQAPAVSAGRRPRVLVTGAGGFLGCRLVECLHLAGAWDVRALVRRPGSAARLARLPVEIVLGDVVSTEDMARATASCDAVVHCAVGTVWPPDAAFAVTVNGTRTTAEAALRAGVMRFVHVSSMAVHGDHVPARLDESVPLEPGSGVDYGRAKYLAEQAVNDAVTRGLNAISLRPARIYGPFSRTFTIRPLQALREGRLQLAGDAESPSNMVFVDNVVEAIVRALNASDSERGEAFLVNDPEQLSWRAFYEYFADGQHVRVVGRTSASERDTRGLARRWVGGARAIALSPELRGLAKKVMWTDPIGTWPRRLWDRSPGLQRRVQKALRIDAAVIYRESPPDRPDVVEFTIDPTFVVSDKAMARLGYRGLVSRDEAMQLTKVWAKTARLI
jgi:predicted dehydrogenase/nucleoside-diphosphate-sugar epimerase